MAMLEAYAAVPDLYMHGLPPALLVAQPRALQAVDPVADAFRLSGHGLAQDDSLEFVSSGGTLPGGLSASAVYYAIPLPDSDALFRVAASPGGSPVALSDSGTGVTAIVPNLVAKARAALAFRARWIDQHLVAHS